MADTVIFVVKRFAYVYIEHNYFPGSNVCDINHWGSGFYLAKQEERKSMHCIWLLCFWHRVVLSNEICLPIKKKYISKAVINNKYTTQ